MLRNINKSALSVVLVVALGTFGVNASANAISAKEANFKAALIYKMASYLSWIPPREMVTYCFVGDDSKPISQVLEQKQVLGKLPKPIKVSNFSAPQSTDLEGCDVIYAPYIDGSTAQVLTHLPAHVFTISNSTKALDKGFIASIELYNKKPLLSISKSNLKSAKVSINSRFLSYVDLR